MEPPPAALQDAKGAVAQEAQKCPELPTLKDQARPNSGGGAGSSMHKQISGESTGYAEESPPRGGSAPGKVVVRRGKWTIESQKSPSNSSTVDTMQHRQEEKEAKKNRIQRRHSTIEEIPLRSLEMATAPRRHSTIEGPLMEIAEEPQRDTMSRSQTESSLAPFGSRAIVRRHSINEQVPTQSLAMDKMPRRFSTIEGTPSGWPGMGSVQRSASSSDLVGSRRPSCLGTDMDGLDAFNTPERKRSVLDMSPRSQRKYNMHKHRLDAEGDSHHSHNHGHRSHSKGSHLGAESLAVLSSKHGGKEEELDPALFGFKLGDKVTPQGGTSEDGPWKDMGEGVVVEGILPNKKHYINVRFKATGDTFSLRGCHLYNLTDPSRSGVYNRGEEKVRAHVCLRDAMIEGETYIADNTLEAAGLEIGDEVSGVDPRGKAGIRGTVVKAGSKPGDVMVRVGDLGIRCFSVVHLRKIQHNTDTVEDKDARASKAKSVDGRRGSLTLNEAAGEFKEEFLGTLKESKAGRRRQSLAADAQAAKKVEVVEAETGLKNGDWVTVRTTMKGNPMWHALGIGRVRGPGAQEGTLQVQFDSGGEVWTLFAGQLERCEKATDRQFKVMDRELLSKRTLGHS